MAWEVFVVNLDGHFDSRNDAAEDEHLIDLGRADEVKVAIEAAFPGTTWSDAGWGDWSGDGGTVGFDLGDDDHIQDLNLHVAADEAVVERILSFTATNGWHAGDTADGPFLDAVDDPAEGLRASRDHA